jgi:hypothetical protein
MTDQTAYKAEWHRRRMDRIKSDPEAYEAYLVKSRESTNRHRAKIGKDGVKQENDARREYKNLWAKNNRAKLKSTDPDGYQRLLDKDNAVAKKCRNRRGPEARLKAKEATQKWAAENPERYKETKKLESQRVRAAVFTAYGNKCACCGESRWQFLAVDHINGGGRKHIQENGLSYGSKFYRWLIRNEFPEGYRLLCHNCNTARGHWGFCPHEDPNRDKELPNPPRVRRKRNVNSSKEYT